MDPGILAVFGPVPPGVDLSESTVFQSDAAVIALVCLALVAVVLRFVARLTMKNPLKADDWAILIALLFIGGSAGLSITSCIYGVGRHVWAITLVDLSNVFKILFIYTYLYASACAMTKISILFFYCRVFVPLDNYLKVAIPFGFFVSISYPIIIWVTMATSCRPLHHFWSQFTGGEGTCIDTNKFFLALGIINMLNDFIVFVIPFPRIVKLQMSGRRKIAICGVMALGCFACVASIVRIHYLAIFTSALDVTWTGAPVFIWSAMEPAVAIVCACLPHLAPLGKKAYKSIVSRQSDQSSSGYVNMPWNPWRGAQRNRRPPGDSLLFTGVDDEIALTNSVLGSNSLHKHASNASTSEKTLAPQSIYVKSSFVQTTQSK